MENGSNQRKGLPRSLQFQRMERVVKAMQHPTAGVPVRSQKLFLTTVPNAFTGNDITEWIMQKLNVKDSSAFRFRSFVETTTFLLPSSRSVASGLAALLLRLFFPRHNERRRANQRGQRIISFPSAVLLGLDQLDDGQHRIRCEPFLSSTSTSTIFAFFQRFI